MKTIKRYLWKKEGMELDKEGSFCFIEDVLGLIDELEPRQIDDGDWPAWEDLIEELKARIEG